MDKLIDLATKLSDAGVVVVLILLLVLACLGLKYLFEWGRDSQAAAAKLGVEREAQLIRAVEAGTQAQREQTKATEAAEEEARNMRLLLEQIHQMLQAYFFSGRGAP